MNLGINFFGPIYSEDGIGEAARTTLQSMLQMGIDVQVNPLPRPTAREKTQAPGNFKPATPHKINYFHFSSRWVPYYLELLGSGVLKSKYNVSHWVCEVMDYPEEWAKNLKHFQEIWTASSFCQESISRVSNIPVIKVPYAVPEPIRRHPYRQKLNLPQNRFLFLNIANAYSDIERKNVLAVVRSFKLAFQENENVGLVLKLCNTKVENEYTQKVLELIGNDPRVIVIDEFLDRDVMNDIYLDCDAYVSLHRAEGFGLTLAEAMLAKRPVISTGYSGNLDFCNPFNSYLVDYKLVEVGHERMRYKKTDFWAEVSIESAAQSFKSVYFEEAQRKLKVEAAYDQIKQYYSFEAVGRIIKRRLGLIQTGFKFSDDLSGRKIAKSHEFNVE